MKYTYVCKKNKPKKKVKHKTKKYTKISLKHNQNLLNKRQKTKKQQKGGNQSHTKEKFEVHSIKNFNYDKYKISKGANVDWSPVGGPPPEPDCCIC